MKHTSIGPIGEGWDLAGGTILGILDQLTGDAMNLRFVLPSAFAALAVSSFLQLLLMVSGLWEHNVKFRSQSGEMEKSRAGKCRPRWRRCRLTSARWSSR